MIQLLDVGRNTERRHGVEYSQWVATFQQLVRVSFVECSSDEQDDIVDHIRIAG